MIYISQYKSSRQFVLKTICDRDELQSLLGTTIATSEWLLIDQKRIDAFADITGDHQWIHQDVDRAQKESPFGSTIAHGFLTLSLIPFFSQRSYSISGFTSKINYGLNRVRFLQPVLVESHIRAQFVLADITPKDNNALLINTTINIEIQGNDTPACVAESLALLLP